MEKFKAGIGLRTKHFPYLESGAGIRIDWFEAISENFMDTEGRPMRILEDLRKDYPIACHGVSLSIASAEDLDFNYLKKLKAFYDRVQPFVVSDHMCWTGFNAHRVHDLLPFPRTKEFLDFLCPKIDSLQEFMGREFAFENLSAYFDYAEAEYTEAEFINEVCNRTGAKMLLDINNVFVNSENFGFDPMEYFAKIDFSHIVQLHVAGFSDQGDFYFDTHSKGIYPELIELFKKIIPRLESPNVLIEWDQDIPELPVVEDQVLQLKGIYDEFQS